MLERDNDDVGSLTVGMAWLRGAAAQHGTAWGIDLSLWWGVINGCVQDLPASLHLRTMFMAYLSGATLLEIEGCGWLDTDAAPLPISQAVDTFGSFVQDVLPPSQRGAPMPHITLAPSLSTYS